MRVSVHLLIFDALCIRRRLALGEVASPNPLIDANTVLVDLFID